MNDENNKPLRQPVKHPWLPIKYPWMTPTGRGMSAIFDYKLMQDIAMHNPQKIIIEKGDSYNLLVKALHQRDAGDVSHDSVNISVKQNNQEMKGWL